ncbi:MAG: type II toxin-antitoxin system PemK/MazF family toxin [Cyanobium sp.]
MTTQWCQGTEALRVPIPARDRLLCNSYAMAEQLRAIDRARLGEGPLTSLTTAEMTALVKALSGVMGLV